MAPENPPPVDPADLPLLTTLEQLRNPAPKNANVSFLRRTQYITSGARGPEGVKSTTPGKAKARPQDKPKVSNDDPMYIKKYLTKGFDIAYPESRHTGEDTADRIKGHTPTKAELDAWANPVHPDNPKLKAVSFFPILPDLHGFPDPGGFVQFKFDKVPVQPVSGKRDERMDVAILHPSAPEERICQEHAAKVSLHKANPSLYPDPGPVPWDYDLFLPEQKGSAGKIKRSLNIEDPDRNNEELYTHDDGEQKFHRYDRVRTYATSAQALNADQKQRDIALSLFDPAEPKASTTSHLTEKAAYYYPILGKTRLKPERARKLAKAGLAPTLSQTKEDQVDQIHVAVRDPDEAEIYKRDLHRAAVDPGFAKTMPPPPQGTDGENEDHGDHADHDENGDHRDEEGPSPAADVEDEVQPVES
jgi:RNA polymerase II-associated factor 1